MLVVDDDPGTVETTAALLRRAGIRVHGAATGEDALATARRQWLDLALIDYRLPGINGLHRRIRPSATDTPQYEVMT